MSQSNFQARILLVLVALALAVTPAYSTAITTYSSLSSWQAVAGGVQTADFEGTPAGTTNGVLTVNGIQFIGYTSYSYPGSSELVKNTTGTPYQDFGTGNALYIVTQGTTFGTPLAGPYLHIVLPSAVTAAAMNLFTYASAGQSLTITLAGTSFTVPTNAGVSSGQGVPTFFGVTSDTAFQTIDISIVNSVNNPNAGTYVFVDNVGFGSTNTPEAATCLLIGSGLIGLVALRRRISRNNAADAVAA